jgi:predicted RND superfamily exporter protein
MKSPDNNKLWFSSITAHPFIILTLCLMLVSAMGWGLSKLQLKSDYREFFSETDPNRESFDRLQNTYAQSDAVFFVIAPKSGAVFDKQVLELVERLTEEAWQLPYSLRVDSLSNFQHTTADDEGLIVENLYEDASSLTPSQLQQIREIAINEKMLNGRLITEASNTTGVAATINFPGLSNDEFGETAQAARVIADKYRALYPEIDILLSGMVMGNNASTEVIKEDAGFLIPLMGLIIIVTLMLLLKSVSATLATLFVLVSSLVAAMGLMGWSGLAITGPSSAAPVIIVTIAVADCVHILVSFFFLTNEGKAKREALIESLRMNLGPIFLTSLTTAIGFLSMNFSDAPPFRVLGNISAIGVIIAFLLSITLLPALIMLLPIKVQKKEEAHVPFLDKLATQLIRYPVRYFIMFVIASVSILFAIPKNEINDQFTKFFSTELEFRQAVDFSNEHLVGVSSLEYALISPDSGGINSPSFLTSVENFTQWLLIQPEVKQVTSLSDTMKRLNRDMHGGDQTWYKIPENEELAAQYLLLYEMSLPFGLDMTNQIDFDKQQTRITMSLEELTTEEILALEARISQWLNLKHPEIEFYNSSGALMFAHISVDNSYSSLIATGIALVLISFILTFALKSLKMGMISLVVNMLPALLTFGLWGLFVGQVGLAVGCAVGMTLGIVVDNTVHFLSKYLRAKRTNKLDTEAAIRYAFSHVGTALLVCNAVLIAGFIVLAQSDFILNKDMGLFTATTFCMALLVDFILLPPLLMFFDKQKRATKEETDNIPTLWITADNNKH